MFKPLVVTQPAHVYYVATEMAIGTAVMYKSGSNPMGEVVAANAAITNKILGFVAQQVMAWVNRPREYDLFPELFLGFTFDPTFINLPGFAAGGKVGVWMEHGSEFETEIYDASGTTVLGAGTAPNTKLVSSPTGTLTPDVADGRQILATVKGPGTGVGLNLNDTDVTYSVVLTNVLAN